MLPVQTASSCDPAILVAHARRVYQVLKSADDLSPKNQTVSHILKSLFQETSFLSGVLTAAESDAVLSCFKPDFLVEFRALLNASEEAMEYYWSSKIFSMPHATYAALKSFIYWDQYAALVGKELALLKAHGAPISAKSCFVGQGPLPMTMLIYQHLTQALCTGVDIELRAIRNAQRLTQNIGCAHCSYAHADGCLYDYSEHDIVFIASLVPVKDTIIEKIKCDRCNQTTYIMVRTAENLSRLYYEPYLCGAKGLQYLGKTDYGAECINTALLYRYN